MAQTRTIEDILLEARQRADAETPDPTVDFTTDVELRRYATKAYRQLLDFIMSCGDAAIELLATEVTLTTPYALPADFYRLLSVDAFNDTAVSQWKQLLPFQWRQRNDYSDAQLPRYRVIAGALRFSPENAAPSSVRLWYVSFPDDLAPTDTVQSFNGWDDWIVGAVSAAICVKEDRDPSPHLGLQGQAAERIRVACADLVIADTQTVAEVEHQYEEIYDLI